MANLALLKIEIDTDPLALGYAGMTDEQVSVSLNALTRDRDLELMTGDELFAQTDTTEFSALADLKKQLWLSFCGRDAIDPFGTANVAFVQWVFGAGTTLTALNASRRIENDQSRADELGLSLSNSPVHDVARARAL